MPLDITNVQIPIGAGLDEKTDQRLLPPGKVTGLTNGIYDKLGTISKRKGYIAMVTGSISGSVTGSIAAIPTLEKLGVLDNELVGIDGAGGYLYSYAPNTDLWSKVDRVPNVTATVRSIAQATWTSSTPDVMCCNGYVVYVWTAKSFSNASIYVGDVTILVVDEETGTVVLPATPLQQTASGYGFNPKIVKSGSDTVTVTFAEYPSNIIRAATIKLPTGTQPYILTQKQVNSSTPTGFGLPHDVCADPTDGYVYLVYPVGAAGQFKVDALVASTLASAGSATRGGGAGTLLFSIACSFFRNDSGSQKNLDVGWSYQTGGTTNWVTIERVNGNPASLASVAGPTTIYSDLQSKGNTFSLFMGMCSTALDTTYIIYNTGMGEAVLGGYLNANAQQVNINGSTITVSGYPVRRTPWINVLSKPFAVSAPVSGGYKICALGRLGQYSGTSLSSAQGTMYLFDTGANDTQVTNLQWQPICTILPRQANEISGGSLQNYDFLFNVAPSSVQARKYRTMGMTLASLESTGRTGISEIELDFSPMTHYDFTEVGEGLHFSSGVPFYYDGLRTGEIGFLYFPDMGMTAAQYTAAAAGGNIQGAGTYQYAVVYEWIDAQGQRHQSAPSIQTAVAVSGVGYVNKVTITIPTLSIQRRQTEMTSGSAGVAAVIYRSTKDGTILYRLTDESSPAGLINVPNTGSLTFVDTKSDGTLSLSSRAPLYTQGGVLPNFCPPSARLACSHVGRVWLAGCDEPKRVWYSKQVELGEAIAFNDNLTFTVDDGGDITAIKGMDDKLIIFKSDRIFYVSGEGPTSLGTQNDLSNPTPIPSDVGCINPRSVVLTPDGIMFQSTIGIMLLTRALEVINIGYPVTDHLKRFPTISSAVVHPYASQVRFTCGALVDSSPFTSNGVTLVYDYLAKAWSIFEIPDTRNLVSSSMAAAAVVHDGNYKWSSATGLYNTGSVGSVFSENDSSGSLAWTDSGNYVPMTVETSWVATNDIQGFQRVRRVSVLGEANDAMRMRVSLANDYSDTYIQSASFPYATSSLVVQNELHVAQQKCQAIRVKVEDLTPVTGSLAPGETGFTTGEGLTLTRVTLRAGTKRGTQKLPPGKRA